MYIHSRSCGAFSCTYLQSNVVSSSLSCHKADSRAQRAAPERHEQYPKVCEENISKQHFFKCLIFTNKFVFFHQTFFQIVNPWTVAWHCIICVCFTMSSADTFMNETQTVSKKIISKNLHERP